MIRTLALVAAFTLAATASAITIDTVPVGNPGNANDPATGNLYGSVNYTYNIGKYDVTIGQYTAFLNAVAATDTYGLYNANMATNLNIAGIAQSCSPNCTYSIIGSPYHPVTYVSWGDAARFANWLHNGQPVGTQNANTTEDGAYTLNGATTTAALYAVTRNNGARWFIPSESEWYKAAFYQPTAQGGDTDNYWAYAMKTNSVPYSSPPPGSAPDNTRAANFYQDDGQANGYDDGYAVTGSTTSSASQNYLTDVGAYTSSPSFYRTFDQGGNVYQWNEAQISNFISRGLCGGSWLSAEVGLEAAFRLSNNPAFGGSDIGFRMATFVPEPSAIFLAIVAFVALPTRRRKSVPHNRV